MSRGKTAADYNGYPDGISKDQINHTFSQKEPLKKLRGKVTVTNMPEPIGPNSFDELDQRLIQLQKNLYTKVDEAKAQINKHIDDDHRDDDIYKFLAHTTRGRFLCSLFGYKSSNIRRIAARKKIRKLNIKRKQIIEV